MATASLALGLVGLFWIPFIDPLLGYVPFIVPLLGLIFGIIALNKINGNPGVWKGKGLAIAGIITSLIGLLLIPVFVCTIGRVAAMKRERDHAQTCLRNVMQMTLELEMVAQDHGNVFPTYGTVWRQMNLDRKTLVCPDSSQTNGYGYCKSLSSQSMMASMFNQPNTVPIFADCSPSAHLQNMLCAPGDVAFRHNGRAIFGYLDGHVKVETTKTQPKLVWPSR